MFVVCYCVRECVWVYVCESKARDGESDNWPMHVHVCERQNYRGTLCMSVCSHEMERQNWHMQRVCERQSYRGTLCMSVCSQEMERLADLTMQEGERERECVCVCACLSISEQKLERVTDLAT